MSKPLVVGSALALVVALAVGVKMRVAANSDRAACVAPDCYGGGVGGGQSRLFPEPLQ